MADETDDFYNFDFSNYLTAALEIDPEQMETLGLLPTQETMFQPVERADRGFDDGSDYSNEGSNSGLGNISPGAIIEEPGIIGGALKSATGWIKDNKELASMIGSGIVGAVKDKNAREMSQAQIDYYKQRQADLNNSVKSYTRNPNQKV